MLEKLRLSGLKRNPVEAEKDKDMKDVSAVTKGVKFAVSMFTLYDWSPHFNCMTVKNDFHFQINAAALMIYLNLCLCITWKTWTSLFLLSESS